MDDVLRVPVDGISAQQLGLVFTEDEIVLRAVSRSRRARPRRQLNYSPVMWPRLIVVIGIAACAASPSKPSSPTGYDPELARRLGADEYGMAKYVMAFLKPGPKRDQPKDEADRLLKAHLANIERLAADGKLVVAGPFLDDGPFAGIYVFRVATVEEARALTATDPAIQAGRFEMELHPWYGSAALQEINALHKRVQQKSVAE